MTWEWSDIRAFLAVADAGTTLGAAKALGMNQTTCARRIAALEAALGVRLFDRSASGYALSAEGQALLPAARALGEAALAFGNEAAAWRRRGLGVLRVTTNDAVAELVLAPAVARFRAAHPDVSIELDVTERFVDIAAGEADIAVRGAEQISADASLIQRRLPDSRWGVYCSPAYAAANGKPASVRDLRGHPIATLGGAILAATRALDPGLRIVDVTNSTNSLRAALQAGYSVGALPCHVGDATPGLERCFLVDPPSPAWLIYAERLRGRPEARAFIDFLVAHFDAIRPQLMGEA
jgi:DNA-binding transcriptional LysR family regulator